jgi:trimethylamine--corrinoid protein Co-methyltransferase
MMRLKTQILSEEEQIRIHQESLRILTEVGVKFHGDKALSILEKHGARVDRETKIARIPRELVEQALQTAPKAFVLGARDPRYDYPLPSPVSRYCLDGTAAFAIDFHTGERRYGTRKDIENGVRVFQEMDMGVMTWAPTCASDAPAHSRALHEFFTLLKFSSKHCNHELHTYAQVPYLAAGLQAVLGSEAEIRRRNQYSLIYCPVAPLMHDGPMLEAYLELGQLGIPVMIMPMPVNGSTGPASLYSNLCLANAESLSSIVIFQLADPGRPLIYSSATGSLDFKNGAYLGGSPEMGLQSAGLTVMGQYYGLPSTSAGCTSDAKQPGPEAILDKLITTIPPVLAGSDIIVGFGEIESDQVLILEQIVVDNELAHLVERMYSGIDINENKNYFEDLAALGPGGNFLKARSTRLAARSDEFYRSDLVDHHPYEGWLKLGKPDIYSNARKKVEEILAGPVVDPLPESVLSELDELLGRADRELKETG